MERRDLERDILLLTDEICTYLEELGFSELLYDEVGLARFQKMISQVGERLSGLMEGRADQVPEAVRQILAQKLPPGVINGPEEFNALEDMIRQVINLAQEDQHYTSQESAPAAGDPGTEAEIPATGQSAEDQSPEPEITTETTEKSPEILIMAEEVIPIKNEPVITEMGVLERTLRFLFPGQRLLRNYALKRTLLQYYLPDMNLALEEETDAAQSDDLQKLYHCRTRGITLVRIGPTEIFNHRQVARRIKRALVSQGKKAI